MHCISIKSVVKIFYIFLQHFLHLDCITYRKIIIKECIYLEKEIPALFKMKYINTISRSIFQVCYSDGENDILLRKGQGIDNISGDYTEYKINDIIKIIKSTF